ncbi:MAG: hypothetical protein E7417_04130 [Ruminococcaceae bacterium]|nr:hypothetical protein [Oscillospiraceae bacterium]
MKRFLALILAVSMVMGLTVTAYAEENPLEGLSKNTAKIIFDRDGCIKSDNVTRVGYKGNVEMVGGKYALRRDHSIEDGRHIQVVTDNEWLYAPNGTTVEIEIEYYDVGNGFMTLRYNGVNDIKWWEGFTTIWSETEKLTMTDTGEWKTYTFYIEDMKAMQEFENTDFQVSLWTHQYGVSPGDAYIRSITIRKVVPREPLKLTTESACIGNNFGPNEDKTIKAKFANSTEFGIKTEVTYKVCDYDGNDLTGTVLKEGTFELENEPNGESEYVFDLNDLTKFSVYRIYMEMKHSVDYYGETVEVVDEEPIGFSIINKPEMHERNKVIGINVHMDKGMEENHVLAGYAGFGQIRESVYWFVTDPEADGTYVIPEEYRQNYEGADKYNVGSLFLATYGPTGYLDSAPYDVYHLPSSNKARKAYADYCKFVLEQVPTIDYVSLWNEPAHHGNEVNPASNYVGLIKEAYPAIKAMRPDLTVIGGGVAQADVDYLEDILEAGGGEYMDAVTFHPYDWSGGTYNLKWLEGNIQAVNDLFIKYTGSKKPIILDEMGMHTDGALGGGETSTAKYAEDEQGASYMKIFGMGRSKHLLDGMYYYDLVDDGMLTTTPEHNFGLVESCFDTGGMRYSAKPGFVQMAGLNKFMWDAEGVECVEKDGIWFCNFKKPNGENIAIAWTEAGSECNADLNLGDNEIEVFDMYTNSLGKMTSGNGVHTVGLTKHPIYIKGNFTSLAVEKSNNGIGLSYTATPDDAFRIEYVTDKAVALKAECDFPDSVVGAEMTGTSIPIETTNEAGGTGYATVKIYNGDDLVYIGQPEINIEDAFMIGVESKQIAANDSNHWHLATTIHNSSNTRSISGTCRIIEVNGQAVDNEPEIFENLMPSEKITLFLNLHEMIKKRNVDLKVEVTLTNGYSKVIEKELDFTAAMYAETPPKIDGIIETGEWKGVWLTADTEDRADYNTGKWNGPDDLSIDANLMWDEKYLYFGAVVTDDVFCNEKMAPGDMWNGDNIQFGIENRVNKGDFRIGMGGTGGSNYTEVGIARLGDGTLATYRWKTQDSVNPVGEIPNCLLEISRKENKTYYEFAIPWTEMISPDYVLDPTEVFGFSICLNESDGGERKGWLEYNGGIGRIKNTILFGKMKLVK